MYYRYQVKFRVKYSDCASWLTLYRDVAGSNEMDARMEAEQKEAKNKKCEWVKAIEAIKLSELPLPF